MANSSLVAAYVLHQQPYRETSSIVHLLCEDDHYLQAVCKGVRSQSRAATLLRTTLQPFVKVGIDISGKSELKNLRKAEAFSSPLNLSGRTLFSAFYLNELIVRINRYEGIAPGVYDSYQKVIIKLASICREFGSGNEEQALAGMQTEASLRNFELNYLKLLGYGVDFEYCADSGKKVEAGLFYQLDPQRGFVLNPAGAVQGNEGTTGSNGMQDIPGEVLLAIAEERFHDPQVLTYAKKICRELIRPLLGGKPLRSRELFLG